MSSSQLSRFTEAAPAWRRFLEALHQDGLGPLSQRAASLERQIRDNGVTYNVYAEESGPTRPWSLGLFPLIIPPNDWVEIEAGVQQRMRVLEAVMADVYGPQTLLQQGLLPPALVQGHSGYLRPMRGHVPVGGTHLHVAAFDLGRGLDGRWRVVSQRMQSPSGLGYLLENRLAVSRAFPQAFEDLHVQRLGGTYRAWMDALQRMSPAGADAHVALLTPGPYNETYFEHAYLARYLGITLVQGSDLIVRDQHLFLKTLRGLEPIHALIKRLDDEFLDPLELRADSTLGVPGLLQAIRAGHVLVANAPGSAFLESPALLGFLPALSQHLLGEDLRLAALPTWWCGEQAALSEALPQLQQCAIKPSYAGSSTHEHFEAVLGRTLTPEDLATWTARIGRQGEDYTLQALSALSQMPTWQPVLDDAQGPGGQIVPRSVMWRVFAVLNGPGQWRVLPGGLARVAGGSEDVASMQRGGSSADVWALTEGPVDRTTLLQPPLTPSALALRKRLVTSRSAENLFWLGRYTERAENAVRLARLTLESLSGEDQNSATLLAWLGQMALDNCLVQADADLPSQEPSSRRAFERLVMKGLGDPLHTPSVAFNLRALRQSGATVRERISLEHWQLMQRAEHSFAEACAPLREGEPATVQALAALKSASQTLAAITGLQTDRMTRDDGWRLLSIGRNLERLDFLANAMAYSFTLGAVHHNGGFEALLALYDSTITFHAQYQQSRDVAALLDLLVLDTDNPRSLGGVAKTLRGRLARLAQCAPDELSDLARTVPDPRSLSLAALCAPGEALAYPELVGLLRASVQAVAGVSDQVSATYFTHATEPGTSLGA